MCHIFCISHTTVANLKHYMYIKWLKWINNGEMITYYRDYSRPLVLQVQQKQYSKKTKRQSDMRNIISSYVINIADHWSPIILNIGCCSPTVTKARCKWISTTNTTLHRKIYQRMLKVCIHITYWEEDRSSTCIQCIAHKCNFNCWRSSICIKTTIQFQIIDTPDSIRVCIFLLIA